MSHRRHTFFVPLIAAAALAAPNAAVAGPLVADAPSCDTTTASQVFLPWADPANYVLAPGGAAESLKGWTVSGKVVLSKANEPWKVHGASDLYSLSIPRAASATTATMCVGIEHPDLRFFMKGKTSVKVDAQIETATGSIQTVPVGVVTNATTGWIVSPQLPLAAALLPLLPGNHTPVRFRFTPSSTVTVQIDDVYVDPFGRY